MFIFVQQKFSFRRCLPCSSYEIDYTFWSISQFAQNKNIYIFKQISSSDCVHDCNWIDDDDANRKKRFWK